MWCRGCGCPVRGARHRPLQQGRHVVEPPGQVRRRVAEAARVALRPPLQERGGRRRAGIALQLLHRPGARKALVKGRHRGRARRALVGFAGQLRRHRPKAQEPTLLRVVLGVRVSVAGLRRHIAIVAGRKVRARHRRDRLHHLRHVRQRVRRRLRHHARVARRRVLHRDRPAQRRLNPRQQIRNLAELQTNTVRTHTVVQTILVRVDQVAEAGVEGARTRSISRANYLCRKPVRGHLQSNAALAPLVRTIIVAECKEIGSTVTIKIANPVAVLYI